MFLFLLNLRGVNEKCHFLKDYLGCAKTKKNKNLLLHDTEQRHG